MKTFFCRATTMALITAALSAAMILAANNVMAYPMEASSSGPVDVHVRELVRGIVTECVSEELPPVEIALDSDLEPVAVEGLELPPGVVCRTLDNYAGATAEGMLTEYKDGMSLAGMTYSATIQGLGTKYRIADFTTMEPASASGARYIAESEVFVDEDLDPLRYYIDFIRRQQADVVDVPATIFMVQKQVAGAILIFILDYRDIR